MSLRLAVEAETWGDRLRRARERSNTRLRDAAGLISEFERTSHQRLLNLEDLEEPPTDAGRRLLALLAAVAYGYDPAAFGLSWDDLPRRLDPEAVVAALNPSSRCIGLWAGQRAYPGEPTFALAA